MGMSASCACPVGGGGRQRYQFAPALQGRAPSVPAELGQERRDDDASQTKQPAERQPENHVQHGGHEKRHEVGNPIARLHDRRVRVDCEVDRDYGKQQCKQTLGQKISFGIDETRDEGGGEAGNRGSCGKRRKAQPKALPYQPPDFCKLPMSAQGADPRINDDDPETGDALNHHGQLQAQAKTRRSTQIHHLRCDHDHHSEREIGSVIAEAGAPGGGPHFPPRDFLMLRGSKGRDCLQNEPAGSPPRIECQNHLASSQSDDSPAENQAGQADEVIKRDATEQGLLLVADSVQPKQQTGPEKANHAQGGSKGKKQERGRRPRSHEDIPVFDGEPRATERFAAKADLVLTVSDFSAKELTASAGIPSTKIRVVPNWVDPSYFVPSSAAALAALRQKLELPGRFWLYVGGFDYRKNVEFLIRAYAMARAEAACPPLILAGAIPADLAKPVCDIRGAIREAGLPPETVLMPRLIETADLPALYSAAELLIYPSLYEGFGLPPAEAMAVGTPVLVSDGSSLPEVVRSSHCRFDPRVADSLRIKLVQATANPQQFCSDLPPEFRQADGIHRYLESITELLCGA